MITIAILGLDQYVTGHYSKNHTANLASLFETEEDDISFYAPQSVLFHKGVEQVSWDTLVIVLAPHKYERLEEKVATYLMKTLKDFSINLNIQFHYFEEEHTYQLFNDDYPRFIEEKNIVSFNDDKDDQDYEADSDDDEEIYTGNVFEGHIDELNRLYDDKNKK